MRSDALATSGKKSFILVNIYFISSNKNVFYVFSFS